MTNRLMADNGSGKVIGSSDGALAGKLGEQEQTSQYLVAPATSSEANTIRLRLIPVACWRVDDIRFAFDSSFVTPDIEPDLRLLMRMREEHKDVKGQYPPFSVFGHADPTGDDTYNKTLSGHRAIAVYAVLTFHSQPTASVSLWENIAKAESWGENQRSTMRNTTSLPEGMTDSALIQAYLSAICPAEVVLTPKDFLAQGADSRGKGDIQGCSRFNPLLIFSASDQARYEQARHENDHQVLLERNMANATNRRVTVLLFRPRSVVLPSKWPCPRAAEGPADCYKRFWSDAEARRNTHLASERRYEQTKDTFACRFYDRLSNNSPCEQHAAISAYPFSM